MVAFKKEHGHASPPTAKSALGTWVTLQRLAQNKGLLDPERWRRLNQIGFSWDPRADKWEMKFSELVAFKEKHGHVKPTEAMPADLKKWIEGQRQQKNNRHLALGRVRRLNALGFSWSLKVDAWEERFEELVAFKKKHGHVNPPGKLGVWVSIQRRFKNKGRLDAERERRLRRLGFSWMNSTDKWYARFAELMTYKNIHGHPSPTKRMGPLGAWVTKQREAKINGTLIPERERLLDSLGFVWKMDNGRVPVRLTWPKEQRVKKWRRGKSGSTLPD